MQTNCPNCGAVVNSEVCPYCGTHINISTIDTSPDYEMTRFKSAKLTFWNVGFWSIFAVGFLVLPLSIIFPIALFTESNSEKIMLMVFLIPFLAVGFGSLFKVISSLVKFLLLKFKGTDYTGTVYGYMDDTVSFNGVNGQQVKILISAKTTQYILLPLGNTSKPYPVNSKVTVRIYKNYADIIEKFDL